jgi:hypothetical protein
LATITFNKQSVALEVDTHKAINRYVVDEDSTFSGYSLDKYLKNNLGINDGVKAKYNFKMIKEWIGNGGVYEDKPPECNIPYARSVNHFHNPINNSGFSGWWNTGIKSGMSAIDWINKPHNTQSCMLYCGYCGYYSWDDVRSYFYYALTAADKATRENYFAETFRGLGQLMHLVKDMSVPEHARNDGHYGFYDYEKWVDANKAIITNSSVISFMPDSSFPLKINNLFDTEQYDGTNPDITYNSNIGLSEYTSANFLSPDTVFGNIPYPAEFQTLLGSNGLYLIKKGHGEENGSGTRIEHLARTRWFYKYLPAGHKSLTLTVNDTAVYTDYAAQLIPRAIGYSSQILSYFFQGKLTVEMSDGSLKVKNASSETMTGGTFELYYDNANGERNKVTITDGAAVSSLAPGGEQTITFTPPPEGATTYILAYSGTLGNESNAIIGKFISANELVVITVALNGITGESLTKKSVLVWNPASNSLERAPIDYDNSDFQTWYGKKTNVGEDMFSAFNHDTTEPHKLAPELIDVGNPPNPDYHADGGSAQIPNTATLGYAKIFPQSIYAKDLLPSFSSPTIESYSGLRTSNERFEETPVCYLIIWADGGDVYVPFPGFGAGMTVGGYDSFYDWATVQALPYGYDGSETNTYEKTISRLNYNFYGLLGEFSSFQQNKTWWAYVDNPANNEVFDGESSTYFIPDWPMFINRYQDWTDREWYIYSRFWYHNFITGKYTNNTIANISLIQYTPCTYSQHMYYGGELGAKTWTFGERTILVQAQALNVPEGTTGYDWIAAGRNNALETQIITVINMVYLLNGIPANEIRDTSISIEIVK